MLAKLLTISGLASAGLLFVILTMTTPVGGGAIAILAVFLLSYIIILSICTFALWFIAKGIERLHSAFRKHEKKQTLTLKKSYYYSSVIALGPVIVVSLQSVGEVGVYELSLIIVFIILGCLYVAKRSS